MADVTLKCSCGAVRGRIMASGWGRRVICMCSDCQAFARYLGRADEILDDNGGVDIYQVTPSRLRIDTGIEHLTCMKLSPKGILRWYTSCCNTPVSTSLSSPQMPLAGVVHLICDHATDGTRRDEALGPVEIRLQAQHGYGDIPSDAHDGFPPGFLMSTAVAMAWQRLTGHHKPSPFFDAAGWGLVCKPSVLSNAERLALDA